MQQCHTEPSAHTGLHGELGELLGRHRCRLCERTWRNVPPRQGRLQRWAARSEGEEADSEGQHHGRCGQIPQPFAIRSTIFEA